MMVGRNNAELRNPVKDSIKICFVGATKAGNEWGRSSPLQIKQTGQNKTGSSSGQRRTLISYAFRFSSCQGITLKRNAFSLLNETMYPGPAILGPPPVRRHRTYYKRYVELPNKSVTFSNSANRKGKTKPRENFISGCQQRSLNRPILGLSHFVKLSNNPWNAVKGNRSLLYILLCHHCRHHVIQHPHQQMQHGSIFVK